jgi:hypothetical protein
MSGETQSPCRACFYWRIGLMLALGALLVAWLAA